MLVQTFLPCFCNKLYMRIYFFYLKDELKLAVDCPEPAELCLEVKKGATTTKIMRMKRPVTKLKMTKKTLKIKGSKKISRKIEKPVDFDLPVQAFF